MADKNNKSQKLTSHAATSEQDCKKMGKKYGWQYSHYNLTNDKILTHDCLFIGDAEFPKQGENDE